MRRDGRRGGFPSAEHARIASAAPGRPGDWKAIGPYLSERAWGTVREDYSADGKAWESFPHDHARSRAYRWSEDGLGGVCDLEQRLGLALAFWNGRDPLLKERIFDRLRFSDGSTVPLRARSMVGLLPIFAAVELGASLWDGLPDFQRALREGRASGAGADRARRGRDRRAPPSRERVIEMLRFVAETRAEASVVGSVSGVGT